MFFWDERFVADYPQHAHFVSTLGLSETEFVSANRADIIEMTEGITPSCELLFKPVRTGEAEGGETHIRFSKTDAYRPKITFRIDDTIGVALWLHEIGHVCCGSERPRATTASRVELLALQFLGSSFGRLMPKDAHIEIAAWATSLILAKGLGMDHRIILCDLLLSATVSHRADLHVFITAIEECEHATGGISSFLEARSHMHIPADERDLFAWACDGAYDLISFLMPYRPDLKPPLFSVNTR